MQSGPGAGKYSHDRNSREMAKLSFGGGTHHLGGPVAVTHSGIFNLHVSLDTSANP